MIVRRLPPLLAGALLLGAGVAAWAQAGGQGDSGAPLEETKKALRQLQKEQAHGKAAVAGQTGTALPTIAAPDIAAATAAGLPAMTGERRRRDDEALRRKREAQSNWLVDGMLRLEGKKADGTPTALTEDQEEPIEASDPDYLLKTYLKEQRASEDAKTKGEERNALANPPADPMAPFLREWLSGSPVEKTALAGFGASGKGPSPDTPGGSPVEFLGSSPLVSNSGGGSGVGIGESGISRELAQSSGSAPNPFLQGLDLGNLPRPGSAQSDVPASGAAPAPVASNPGPVFSPLPEPVQGRPAERRPPPSALKENEKYFPQQKRF